jgi:hypothetical protein
VLNALYDHEPNLWSYVVEGAPILLSETISSVRMLVNGSQGLLDSLNIVNDNDLVLIEQVYNIGYKESMVTLEATPLAVNNVVVGSTEANPTLWHQVQLQEPHPYHYPNPYPTLTLTLALPINQNLGTAH